MTAVPKSNSLTASPDTTASPSPAPADRRRWVPYLLSLPALALFAVLLLVPLAMTALLSLNSFGF
ncbi:MAG: ABC transporter permease, partial [Thermoanaerobaculia bacterium]